MRVSPCAHGFGLGLGCASFDESSPLPLPPTQREDAFVATCGAVTFEIKATLFSPNVGRTIGLPKSKRPEKTSFSHGPCLVEVPKGSPFVSGSFGQLSRWGAFSLAPICMRLWLFLEFPPKMGRVIGKAGAWLLSELGAWAPKLTKY